MKAIVWGVSHIMSTGSPIMYPSLPYEEGGATMDMRNLLSAVGADILEKRSISSVERGRFVE